MSLLSHCKSQTIDKILTIRVKLLFYLLYSIKLIFRHPNDTNLRNIFLQPFHEYVWFGALIIVVICSVMLYISKFIETSLCVYSRRKREQHSDRMWILSFIMIIGVFCQQGYSETIRFISSKVIVLTSLLFSFILFQFYSASIVGSLLSEPPRKIRTVEDVIKSGLEVGSDDLPYNLLFFKVKKYPTSIDQTPFLLNRNLLVLTHRIQLIRKSWNYLNGTCILGTS